MHTYDTFRVVGSLLAALCSSRPLAVSFRVRFHSCRSLFEEDSTETNRVGLPSALHASATGLCRSRNLLSMECGPGALGVRALHVFLRNGFALWPLKARVGRRSLTEGGRESAEGGKLQERGE